LQDAASIAGPLITTEAMVAERPKADAHPAGHPHPRMGGHGLLTPPAARCSWRR
jgi:hypothetical protein